MTRGTHPVVYVRATRSPTGDRDRVQGEEVAWEEVHSRFFKLFGEDVFLPAATFRPRQFYRVSRSIAQYPDPSPVDGKYQWIVSEEDGPRRFQKPVEKITVIEEIKGNGLIKRYAWTNPLRQEDSLPSACHFR